MVEKALNQAISWFMSGPKLSFWQREKKTHETNHGFAAALVWIWIGIPSEVPRKIPKTALQKIRMMIQIHDLQRSVKLDVHSGNQTWQWKMDHLSNEFTIKTFIHRGFSISMFDCQRVDVVVVFFKHCTWNHQPILSCFIPWRTCWIFPISHSA